MKVIITIAFVSVVAFVHAAPPPPPSRADLTDRSDIVAIVTVTNVTDHVSTEATWKLGRRQSAIAVVDRILKGTAPRTVRLTFEGPPMRISCQPPSLSTGQFLVFLRREGVNHVRADTWYGQATINTNHVNFRPGHPIPLETVVREIERTAKSQ